jgi:hypothetical protein
MPHLPLLASTNPREPYLPLSGVNETVSGAPAPGFVHAYHCSPFLPRRLLYFQATERNGLAPSGTPAVHGPLFKPIHGQIGSITTLKLRVLRVKEIIFGYNPERTRPLLAASEKEKKTSASHEQIMSEQLNPP